MAAKNINLGTVQTAASSHLYWDSNNQLIDSASQDNGSILDLNNLQATAAGNISAANVTIHVDKALQLTSGWRYNTQRGPQQSSD